MEPELEIQFTVLNILKGKNIFLISVHELHKKNLKHGETEFDTRFLKNMLLFLGLGKFGGSLST